MPTNENALIEFIDKMEELGQFQDKIDISSTIGQIWGGFLSEIRKHIIIDVCALFLVDEESYEFKLNKAYPEEKKDICQKEVEYQIEGGMFSWIINRRKPAIIPSFVFKDQKTIIMLPLSTMKRTIGVVMVLTPLEESAITQENLRLMTMLAKQCSLVMENSILYNNLREEHEALQVAQARVLQAEKLASIGRLTAGASHEILNPLNVISGHIQLLLMKDGDIRNGQKPLEIIKSQTERITNIVKGLAQFSRYSDSKKTDVDIGHLVNKFADAARLKMIDDKIKLKVENAPDLPEIEGVEKNLFDVFKFLLSNSKDAMPKGGTVTIRTSVVNGHMLSDKNGRHIRLDFNDTGCGIPKKNIEKIFEPFFTTKGGEYRTGLGLSLGYGIIRDHDGEMQVESEENKGTNMIVYLPLKKN